MTTSETKSTSDPAENTCLDVSIADIMSKDVITVAEDDPVK
jgi:CBS-domain-containing membrane protein